MRIKTLGQQRRALAEREANLAALLQGEPLPYPNLWDALDPTKVSPEATNEEIQESYRAFTRICRRQKRKIVTP